MITMTVMMMKITFIMAHLAQLFLRWMTMLMTSITLHRLDDRQHIFPTCQMSHVFRPRSKAAETQAEDATKKVPGRLN